MITYIRPSLYEASAHGVTIAQVPIDRKVRSTKSYSVGPSYFVKRRRLAKDTVKLVIASLEILIAI